MVHLNLDQATKKFGISVFDDDKLIASKFFNLSESLNNPSTQQEIDMVKNIMLKFIDLYKVEVVSLENIFLNNFKGSYSNYTSFVVLAKLLGVLENALYERNMLYFVVNASTWRSTCKIKGKKGEQKQNAINFVRQNYKIDVEEDLAEAICLGHHTAKKLIPKIKVIG